MSRVRSDENYSQEESLEDQSPAAPTAKLGEGLPLLQRLRLLKEKQDREERGKPLLTPTSPPAAPSTLSPPTLKLQSQQQEPQEQEVVGAGLPLIQRLRLLKQKEDRERLAMQTTAAVAVDVLATTVKTQHDAEPKSIHSTGSPPGRNIKGRISDDSRHSSSSKEQSEDESSLVCRKPSLLDRLVSVKNKDTSGAGVPPRQKSDTNSSSSADLCMAATTKVPLLRDKLKLLTQKDSVPSSSSSLSSSAGTVISPAKLQAQPSAKCDSDSSNSSIAVLKKQHSWSLLKKASILSSQNSNECSKEPAVTVQKSTVTCDISSPSNQVQCGGASTLKSIEQQNSELIPVRTASADETKVITVCDNSDSESIPSKAPSSIIKVNEVSSGKSVSLFKQKVAKLTGEDQGQQPPISQVSQVQDKLKSEETQVSAQGDNKETEDNKLKENTIETCSQERKEPNYKYSRETASSVGITEETAVQPMVKAMDPSISTPAETAAASPQRRRPKPNLLRLQQDTKFYMSIDDLSPEYSGLPFVKKLKILNERQKLAELEQKVAHVLMRSSSLDSSNAVSGVSGGSGDSTEYILDPINLTRSHSEASAMQYVRSQQIGRDSFSRNASQTSRKDDGEERTAVPPQRPTELPQAPASEAPQSLTSPESNETLERRNLKSILKKLSASSLFSGSTEDTTGTSSSGEQPDTFAVKGISTDQPAAKPSAVDMHKLMRAPTIEGYAARHSKLTKSVTFNRDTLQSPPATAKTPTKLSQEPSGSLFPLPVALEGQTISTVPSTCIPTSTTTISTTVTQSAVSSTSPTTSSTTPVPQQETLPQVTTSVTIALPTTLPSVVSPPPISSTVSCMLPLSETESKPSQVSAAIDLTQLPTDTTDSVLKKKPQVSLLVQHPHQMPLSTNEKNFFRPSLLLPSHASLEEEYFNEVIVGIKQVIQGHLVSSLTVDEC
jgi:hypothetical protein